MSVVSVETAAADSSGAGAGGPVVVEVRQQLDSMRQYLRPCCLHPSRPIAPIYDCFIFRVDDDELFAII